MFPQGESWCEGAVTLVLPWCFTRVKAVGTVTTPSMQENPMPGHRKFLATHQVLPWCFPWVKPSLPPFTWCSPRVKPVFQAGKRTGILNFPAAGWQKRVTPPENDIPQDFSRTCRNYHFTKVYYLEIIFQRKKKSF